MSTNNQLFATTVNTGDVFMFPKGLLHFELNMGEGQATAIAALNNQNPRLQAQAAALFKLGISDVVLEKTFGLNEKAIDRPNNKVWVPVNVLPIVAVSLPPPLPFSEETGSPSNDVQPNHRGSLTFLLTKFLATEITKEDWFSFLLLCLKVSFLLFFSPSLNIRIWFVCFCCCLSLLLLISVLMLAMLYNCLKF
jgi:hypothetical protein